MLYLLTVHNSPTHHPLKYRCMEFRKPFLSINERFYVIQKVCPGNHQDFQFTILLRKIKLLSVLRNHLFIFFSAVMLKLTIQ